MLDADIWVRDVPEAAPAEAGEARDEAEQAVPFEERESFKRVDSLRATGTALPPFLQNGGMAIVTGDRESDLIELLVEPRHPNVSLIVRSKRPRKVEAGDGELSLRDVLEAMETAGEYVLAVSGQPGRPARSAKIGVKFAAVTIIPPSEDGGLGSRGARDRTARRRIPDIVDPAEHGGGGRLPSGAQGRRRWVIERLHYTLKTGCFEVERLQFDDCHTLANALAFYYIVAWHVLSLVYWSREDPDSPAEKYIDAEQLSILRRATPRPINTMLEAVKAIAGLAEYANYANSPPPGVKMTWSGMRRLMDMVDGAKLFAPGQ